MNTFFIQRPFRSTSSNDEGISEMDALDNSSASGSEIFRSKDSQMLSVKAEMLKVSTMFGYSIHKVYGQELQSNFN